MNKVERLEAALEVAKEFIERSGGHRLFAAKDKLEQINAILAPPPPEYEEVEVVSWAIIAPSGFIETTSANEELQRSQVGNTNSPFYGYQVAKLTGTIKRPKKQPVERSVTAVGVKFDSGDCGTSIWPHGANLTGDATVWSNLHGKTGTLTFTWQEDV